MNQVQTLTGPHIRTANTTRNIMLHVAISLMPALLGSIYFFGIRSLYITGFSVTVCVLTEYFWQKNHKKIRLLPMISALLLPEYFWHLICRLLFLCG